jgi:hypothetical protein
MNVTMNEKLQVVIPPDATKKEFLAIIKASCETERPSEAPAEPPNVFERFFLADVSKKIRAGIAPAEAPKPPTPTPAPADLSNDVLFNLEAEKLSRSRGITILDAAREILRDRELDRQIAEAKKGA